MERQGRYWRLAVALLAALTPAISVPDRSTGVTCRKPFVEILVSPIASKKEVRMMELSWYVEEGLEPGDWVGLHVGDPDTFRPLFWAYITEPKGWLSTGIQENRTMPEPSFKPNCTPYWAAYWRKNGTKPVAKYCLGTNPRWMENSRDTIKHLSIDDMFLPGTHDSGSFHLSYGPYKPNRYNKYVYTQDESILEQLIHGARYLDLRISQKKGKWWLNHGVFRIHPFEYILMDIKEFLDNTKEILVLDFHRFPKGFDDEATHEQFVAYLRKELWQYAAPGRLTWAATLADIWATDKRLILAYNHSPTREKHSDILWRPVTQKWPNVQNIDKLRQYFQDVMTRKPWYPWAAMAQLTPTVWSVISDEQGGLRKMAHAVNHEVTSWFRADWGRLSNAVAVDFIRSTGVVHAAVRWNKRRALNAHCDP
uniref:Venom phospholipase C n=1 Tax=Lethocerus distinctifemur TaxID=280095 RepID=A0A2K8JUA2_9HEMI|nr:venom phospholipase C [Lethocerus distinctifemur]